MFLSSLRVGSVKPSEAQAISVRMLRTRHGGTRHEVKANDYTLRHFGDVVITAP